MRPRRSPSATVRRALRVPLLATLRWGVIARQEAYLERKFGDEYRAYRARVRRWV